MARPLNPARLPPALAALALAGCLEAEAPPLPDEARAALLATLANPVSARFDPAGEVAPGVPALLCGGQVSYSERPGARAETRAYLYRRGRGVALEGRDAALFDELARECDRATKP